MSVAQLKKLDAGRVEVFGALGLSEVTEVLKHSKEFFNGNEGLIFDLKGVDKADSSGLSLVVEWMGMAKRSGQTIAFKNIPEQMLEIARLSGLDAILPIAE